MKKMEINNPDYLTFLNDPCGDIPRNELSGILEELMVNAMFYINTSLEDGSIKQTKEAIIYLLKNEFKYYPLSIISEAFMKETCLLLRWSTV